MCSSWDSYTNNHGLSRAKSFLPASTLSSVCMAHAFPLLSLRKVYLLKARSQKGISTKGKGWNIQEYASKIRRQKKSLSAENESWK